ncbi:MAG: nuclear transport factor 2 family protein [Rhodocyclaceae bacterium]|jgi:ketosteroid isomerase-like protein|nr:nuclear transport factor 2 family protein [Rhodocyclaceae bacterium]
MPTNKLFFASAQDVEAAFYEAIERADLDALMAVWAEDEEIVCIHPGSGRISGYLHIRESWRRIFEGGARLRIRTRVMSTVVNPFAAVHSLIEEVALRGAEEATAAVTATNIYVRGPLGWRMVMHHGSAAPAESSQAPQTLH